jgi:Peptidase family S41
MKFIIFFISILMCNNSFGQSESIDDFNFLLKKIQKVYAGYSDKVKNNEFKILLDEIKRSKSKDTFMLLSKMTTYFNDYHLSLFKKNILETVDMNILKQNLSIIKKAIKDKTLHNSYWINEYSNKIVCLIKINKNKYEGYLLETKHDNLKGLKLFTLSNDQNGKWDTDFINIDGNYRVFTKTRFKDSNTLITGSYEKWRKIDNYHNGILNTKPEFFEKAELIQLDKRNILLTMPDFSEEFIPIYDSLIKKNNSIISESENLIIDLRNNQGGYTNCFDSIIPFACEKDIITIGGYVLCSDEIVENAVMDRDDYIKSKKTSYLAFYDNYIKNLKNNKDSFYFTAGDTIRCKAQKTKLKNIAIIINYGCRSAAELMLLYLKQSTKVKLFGEPTAGAVDYLDILRYKLPRTEYKLWVGTVKREITDAQPLYDKNGIKPDVHIDDTVPNWVEFVKAYYERN